MLKVIKGARVLVDCESEELYMDLGDGQCRPLGGSSDGGASSWNDLKDKPFGEELAYRLYFADVERKVKSPAIIPQP